MIIYENALVFFHIKPMEIRLLLGLLGGLEQVTSGSEAAQLLMENHRSFRWVNQLRMA